jgi:hypothetical protein
MLNGFIFRGEKNMSREHGEAVNRLAALLAKWIVSDSAPAILATAINVTLTEYDTAHKERFSSAAKMHASAEAVVTFVKSWVQPPNRATVIRVKYPNISADNALEVLHDIMMGGHYAAPGHRLFGLVGEASLNTRIIAHIVDDFKKVAESILVAGRGSAAEFNPELLLNMISDLNRQIIKPEADAQSIFEQMNAALLNRTAVSCRNLAASA